MGTDMNGGNKDDSTLCPAHQGIETLAGEVIHISVPVRHSTLCPAHQGIETGKIGVGFVPLPIHDSTLCPAHQGIETVLIWIILLRVPHI